MIDVATDPTRLKRDSRGYWYVQWYDDSTPKRRLTRTFGRDYNRAAILHARWLESFYLSPDVRNAREAVTVGNLIDAYLAEAGERYRHADGTPTGHARALACAIAPFRAMFGDLDPRQLVAPDHPPVGYVHPLVAFQQDRARSGWARSTINSACNRIRHFIRWGAHPTRKRIPTAAAAEFALIEPLVQGRTTAREAEPVGLVDWATVEATMAYLPPTLQAAVRLLWLTAMRPIDLCRMEPRHIDLTMEPWAYTPPIHKTSRHGVKRIVRLGPQAREVLGPMLAGRAMHAPVFDPRQAMRERQDAKVGRYEAKGYDYRAWPSYQHRHESRTGDPRMGERYTPGSLRQAIVYACRTGGIEPWTPYQLKHSAMTRLEREFGRLGSGSVAGHVSVAAADAYVEREMLNDERAREIMERVG